MSRDQIYSVIVERVKYWSNVDYIIVNESSNFAFDLNMDRVDLLEFISTLSGDYSFEYTGNDIDSMVVVKDLIDFLEIQNI